MTEKTICIFNEKSTCTVQNDVGCPRDTACNWEKCTWYHQGLKYKNIDRSVKLPPDLVLGDLVTIKKGAIIYPHVKLGNNVAIGHYCIIHENVDLFDNTEIPDFSIVYLNVVGDVILMKPIYRTFDITVYDNDQRRKPK